MSTSAARCVNDPRMPRHGRKQTPEVADQLAPRRWRKLQPLQDGRRIRRRRTPFARHRLAGRPVQQLQVIRHGQGQETFVAAAAAATIAARPWFAAMLVQLQRGQEPIGSRGRLRGWSLRRPAIVARGVPPLFAARGDWVGICFFPVTASVPSRKHRLTTRFITCTTAISSGANNSTLAKRAIVGLLNPLRPANRYKALRQDYSNPTKSVASCCRIRFCRMSSRPPCMTRLFRIHVRRQSDLASCFPWWPLALPRGPRFPTYYCPSEIGGQLKTNLPTNYWALWPRDNTWRYRRRVCFQLSWDAGTSATMHTGVAPKHAASAWGGLSL